MGLQDFISESEAASCTGVSLQTLTRFAEAGYLQVEIDADGMRLFSRSELCDVFGIPPSMRKNGSAAEPPRAPAPPQSAIRMDKDAQSRPPPAAPVPPAAQPAAVPPPIATPAANPPPTEGSTQAPETPAKSLEIEVIKLRSVVSLQERLLDLRDTQLKDLKEEREWLRARIDKLDEKSDRDQLLLLSETQTIRKLVAQNQAARSTFRSALEWLGVLEPQASLASPPLIELNHRDREPSSG